jgi:hypothetical protein
MSRGPGKWERAILQSLEHTAAFYLTDLLPTDHSRAQLVALNRAARNLEDKGRIATCAWMCRAASGVGFKTIYRPGYPRPARDHITRLNVAHISTGDDCNT